MKWETLLVLALGLSFAVASGAQDGGQKELKKIEGTYILIRGEEDGKTLSKQVSKKSRLTLKGNKHHVVVGEVVIQGTHKLDPTKTPTEIDTEDMEGPYKGHVLHGIYKFAGDEFTVCFANVGKDRPKEFTTKSGTGHILHIWKKK